MILVDTSVWIDWSNDKNLEVAIELDRLLGADEVATTDPVIAEVLQGAKTQAVFHDWSTTLDALHYFPVTRDTWVKAAELSLELRRKGLATALTDLLVAQIALTNDLPVFTTDSDYQHVPGLVLHAY